MCIRDRLLVWVEIGHKGLEGHVHLLHGGVVPDAQQLVSSVSLGDVQVAFEVLSDNSLHTPKSHAIALNTQGLEYGAKCFGLRENTSKCT